ncbi:hypothetical protein PR048_024057 [Dryococelus australis]|uniref:Reverse transcriptase n=1 Tax=Dryococelus australis TaxID=614101 RepID=A0ABQ9GVT9_9NEOP|nr:hypothetical protein PR048_024057 [Dryococelus australis]
MEQCRNARAGETGYPLENTPTSGIDRYNSHSRKSGSDPGRGLNLVRLAAVAEWLACSPPTKANQVQSAAGVTLRFSRVGIVPVDAAGYPVSPALAFRHCSILTSFYPHRTFFNSITAVIHLLKNRSTSTLFVGAYKHLKTIIVTTVPDIGHEYWRILQKKRQTAWREHVTHRGNQDPWGLVYRMVTGKSSKEITRHMLVTLLPDDTAVGETELHERIRAIQLSPMKTEGTSPFSAEELDKKSPGLDGMTGEMILRAYPRIRQNLLDMFNDCFKEWTFPSGWKKGLLIVIYKGGGRNPRKAKSYRPITLLQVFGEDIRTSYRP